MHDMKVEGIRKMSSEVKKFSKQIKSMFKKRSGSNLEHSFDAIAKAILDRIEETKSPRYLAEGNYAEVYWLRKQSKKILKLTTDNNDAYAFKRLLDNPQKHLIKVYDVFQVSPLKLYGIVAEKLTPMSKDEQRNWLHFLETLDTVLLGNLINLLIKNGLSHRWVDEYVDTIENPEYYVEDKYEEEFEEPLYIPDLPEKDILKALRSWGKELQTLHIRVHDLHTGNIMTRRGDYILVDLGYGHVPATRIDPLYIASL